MKAQASIDALVLHSKQLALLWLAGFREACCFHRVYFFCKRSRVLLIRTGQCFILNGLIFLGSILLLKSVVTPILLWLLPEECWQSISGDPCYFREALKFYSFLRYILIELFYVLWFYPLYVFSFILSSIWYNDIAKQAFIVVGSNVQLKSEPSSLNESLNSRIVPQLDRPGGFGGVIIGIGEQLYSILLLSFFFIEVFAVGFIPCIGKTVNFLLLSWMYAYYCFEYKWNLSELGLEKRLDLFETNWAFFAGFGSPCVLAIFFFSQLVSYGVMAILFPLFVLTATGTQGEKVIDSHKKSWNGWGPRKLPVFHIANALSMQVLKTFSGSPNEQEQDKKFF